MTARYFAFEYKGSNDSQVVLYWYETAFFASNGTAQTKSIMISLITYPLSQENIPAAENQELPIAESINNYWQPIRTWSTAALAISQNGLVLAAASTAVLAAAALYTVYSAGREKKRAFNLYKKLSKPDKEVVNAVAGAEKQGRSSVGGVLAELQKLTNAPVDETWLMQKIGEAQKAGLIEESLVNKDDLPFIQWKSCLQQ